MGLWFLAVLIMAAMASSAQAQTGTATVAAILGPTTPTFTDEVTATVTVSSASAPVPSGSITWDTDSGTQSTAPLVNGVARVGLKFFAPGAHTFDYSYSGDGTYAAVALQTSNFTVADRALSLYGSEHRLQITGPSQYDNVAINSKDDLIVPDQFQNKLFRIDPMGNTTVIPTTGLNTPLNVILDKQDNIFIADNGNARVVEITAAGAQSVLPITGLTSAVSLAFDPAYQSLYVVDLSAGTIVIYNLAAQTQTSFSPGIPDLTSVAVDPAGIVYYAQGDNIVDQGHLYRRDTVGNVTEIFTGLPNMGGLFFDAKGDLYIASSGIFVLDPQGHLTELTPTGTYASPSTPATDSRGRIYIPVGNAIDVFTPGTSADAGAVYAANVTVDPAYTIALQYQSFVDLDFQAPYQQSFTSVTVANGALLGLPNFPPETGLTNSITSVPFLLQAYFFSQPNLPGYWSTSATITTTGGATLTSLVYGIGVNTEFAVTPGTVTPGALGVSSVGGVATDGNGNVYVSDTVANQVLKVSSSASAAVPFTGLNAPTQLAVDGLGAVFVLDSGSARILRVDAQGNQSVAFDLSAQTALTSLSAFAMDGGDNLYIAGQSAGGQAAIYLIDTLGNQLPLAQNISLPASLAFDGFGNLYSTETAGGNLRRYNQAGNPTLVATGLTQPSSIAVDPGGTAFVTGPAGSGITIVHPDGTTTPYPSAALVNASAVTSDGQGNLVVGDNTGKQIFGVSRAEGQAFLYDFGNVPLGTPETYTGMLMNAGNAVTSDWGITASHDETALASNPNECIGTTPTPNTPLPAGGYCNMSITFTPTYLGAMNDSSGTGDTYYITQPSTFGIYLALTLTGSGATPTGAPTLTPNPLNFGNVAVNTTTRAQQITLQNNNNTALTISSIAISGPNAAQFSQTNTCAGTTLPSNIACAIEVTFTPNAVGAATATITVTDNATTSTSTVTIEGTGVAGAGQPSVRLSPATNTFPTTAFGSSSAAQTLIVSNSGSAAATISSITLGGASATSFALTNGCGATLAVNASCNLSVVFTPTAAGQTFNAAVSVASNDQYSPATATLSGTSPAATTPGAPIATLTPASLTYSATMGTTTAAQIATLTNSGTATLNISGITITGSNASEFAISANTCGATLAVGASCAISATFSPDSAASFTAAISVADDAAGSPQSSTITGTGTAAAAAADFVVDVTPPTQTVASGSSAMYPVNVTSTGGSFTNAISLTASGLPPGATATFSPASITPGAAGAQSMMTVQTAAQQTASSRESSRWPLTAPVFAAVLLLIPGWRARRRWNAKVTRAFFTGAGCLLFLLGMMATITGCGAGFAMPQSQSGSNTYTITVTGTSGSVQHNTTVQITVR
ncbi:sugar lactone lactonase YvrE [Silvibacterium bohemicum]|uniref:Sugar lactone lactonase YvrE n=1 Tax=Silvibacterium bohemicum TaxID=1577686 RepID=A0A841K5J9_9BACT|nr:choice-of-anchor D domain-containing protein [Silvibacterium bohemicum]MBB6145878.1 sugar lactone lactonase YvrE [Silvibacterium bohemicum]